MTDFTSALNHSYDGIWVIDSSGKVLDVNSKVSELYQIASEKLIGKNAQELLNEGITPERTMPIIYEAFQNKAPTTDVVRICTNKEILITATPIFDNDGNPWRVIVNNREINDLLNDVHAESDQYRSKHKDLRCIEKRKSDNFLYNKGCAESNDIKSIMTSLFKVANTDLTLLFEGETGVGKEFFARYAYELSSRNHEPFISVNCAALPDNLVESILFGHEKGAFTGADRQFIGSFEQAQGGTIMLDEIGELSLPIQAKLLRVLQEKVIQKLGSEKTIELDVRVFVATNKNLKLMVEEGTFREDLYYRLNVISFNIPPLRKRASSIPALIRFFSEKVQNKYNIKANISPKAIEYLSLYIWPGNIRELENVVIQMLIMSDKKNLDIDQIPSHIISIVKSSKETDWNLDAQLEKYEKAILIDTLQKFTSIRKASTALGVTHPTLLRKIKKYNLEYLK